MATTTTAFRLRGRELLRDPRVNKGSAFSAEERAALGLDGLLPAAVMTLDQQARRSYEQYSAQPTSLARNDFLAALRDRNEVLYYNLLEGHLKEMLPVIYDPVVAEAIERYSHEYQRPDGVYLSIDDGAGVETALRNYGLGPDEVDLLVATDGEAILGIGDWGVNGFAISAGKLGVYTVAAGIDPDRVIAVSLDVGTDNEALLNDPLYIGTGTAGSEASAMTRSWARTWRRRRICSRTRSCTSRTSAPRTRGGSSTSTATGCGSSTTTSRARARSLLAILAGMRVAHTRPSEQRVVIFGAGTAGMGIADQIRTIMVNDGLSPEQATRCFWAVDRQGLLLDDMQDLRDFQQPYSRPRSEVSGWGSTDLGGVVANVHPTIMVGTSTVGGAFTEQTVREMAKHVERPLIFPLSNPTERIEAIPGDLIKWTEGRALIGTGTPWDPVPFDGVDYEIGQANNALIYPGIGLGTIVSRAAHVTDEMLLAAAEAIAGLVDGNRPGARLLPDVENLRASSATVAVAVANQAASNGVAASLENPVQAVQDAMWQAAYRPLVVA